MSEDADTIITASLNLQSVIDYLKKQNNDILLFALDGRIGLV